MIKHEHVVRCLKQAYKQLYYIVHVTVLGYIVYATVLGYIVHATLSITAWPDCATMRDYDL